LTQINCGSVASKLRRRLSASHFLMSVDLSQ
jgi:hypothetical protein